MSPGQAHPGLDDLFLCLNKPKGVTVTGRKGPNAGKTFPAIYELKSDTLRICYDLSGAKRPTEFKSDAGTQLFLVTYSRKKS